MIVRENFKEAVSYFEKMGISKASAKFINKILKKKKSKIVKSFEEDLEDS